MVKSLKLIIEALLFSAEKPLTIRDINACVPDVKPPEIRSAIKVLTYEYEAMGRSFLLKEIGGGYQFRSRTEYGSYILRMLQTAPTRLSKAALETLAIIAYKQPIIRQEIERFRGVDVGGILRTLMEKGLIRIVGRKDLPGRPLIYGTTKKFLEVFDLKDIKALPSMKEMKAFGAGEEESESLFEKPPQEDSEESQEPPLKDPEFADYDFGPSTSEDSPPETNEEITPDRNMGNEPPQEEHGQEATEQEISKDASDTGDSTDQTGPSAFQKPDKTGTT